MVGRETYYVTTTSELTLSQLAEHRVFVGSGTITVTLPTPGVDYADLDAIDYIQDDATLDTTLSCSNGFPNALDTVTVTAGQAVRLKCCSDLAGSYTWYVIGGTAA